MAFIIDYLTPWEFSPAILLCSLAAGFLYLLGIIKRRRNGVKTGIWRGISFYAGLISIYVVMQTYIDYLSQHMFWVHRVQHLVLHHLGPFLIALSVPQEVMQYGIPESFRNKYLVPIWRCGPISWIYGFLQNPIVAPTLFISLIYIWLIPSVHFDAMLSANRYKLMNWSMLVDGILFWWLMMDPRKPDAHRTISYPIRILILWSVMILQIIVGAYITLSKSVIYDVYSVCGRAWPISPLTDQTIGGLTTWIPTAMMSVLGILLVIRMWMQQEK